MYNLEVTHSPNPGEEHVQIPLLVDCVLPYNVKDLLSTFWVNPSAVILSHPVDCFWKYLDHLPLPDLAQDVSEEHFLEVGKVGKPVS